MQRLLLFILLSVGYVQTLNAQFVTLPDPKLRDYLQQSNFFNQCFNGAGELDTLCANGNTADYLQLFGDFTNLEGVQYFHNVTTLACFSPSLTSLPKLPPRLVELGIGETKLTSLPYLPSTLVNLSCSNNQLTSLPNLPDNLTFLDCSNNKIKTLPVLPANLVELICDNNQLSSLPALPKNITSLQCKNNLLTLLPVLPVNLSVLYVSGNPNLMCLPKLTPMLDTLDIDQSIKCISHYPLGILSQKGSLPPLCNTEYNPNQCTVLTDSAHFKVIPDDNLWNYMYTYYPQILDPYNRLDTQHPDLDVIDFMELNNLNIKNLEGVQYFKKLRTLHVNNNQLKAITVLPPNLSNFECYNNELTSLPTLPVTLTDLFVAKNKLSSLPTLPTNLITLGCQENPDLLCLPLLPKTLGELAFDTSIIKCLPNRTTAFLVGSVFKIPKKYPICSEVNANHCPVLKDSGRFVIIEDLGMLLLLNARHSSCWDRYERMDTSCSALSTPYFGDDLAWQLRAADTSYYYIENLKGLQYVNSLDSLVVDNYRLSSTEYMPKNLKKLSLTGNFQQLTVTNLPPTLKVLELSNFAIVNQPFGIPSGVKSLKLERDSLDNLPALPPGLEVLNCSENYLDNFPPFPTSLKVLNCTGNALFSVSKFPPFAETLVLDHTMFSKMPQFPKTLKTLSFQFNRSVPCVPYLPDGLQELYVSGRIDCLPNRPMSLAIDGPGSETWSALPICDSSSQSNPCIPSTVYGTAYIDANGSTVYDAGDYVMSGVKIGLTGGQYTFTDAFGRYTFKTELLGLIQVTVFPPAHFKEAFAATLSNLIDAPNSNLKQNFELVKVGGYNDMVLDITHSHAARPGFAVSYTNIVSNSGNSDISPELFFTYDDALVIDSVSVPYALVGKDIKVSVNSLRPNESSSFVVYAKLKTDVPLGYDLSSSLKANAASLSISKVSTIKVSGSFDPNDKKGTENITPEQLAKGEYIDYTIRFQNTGTDTAFTVVIDDELSSLFDVASLQILSTSHPCKTSIDKNIANFRFENILLPDSNRNEPASHGFVKFKIKPLATVKTKDVIKNTAYIYFDFNAPVITNTTSTTFNDFVTGQYDASMPQNTWLYPNPAKDRITVLSTEPKTFYLYNTTGQAVLEAEVDGTTEINIEKLQPGLYLYSMDSQKGKIMIK